MHSGRILQRDTQQHWTLPCSSFCLYPANAGTCEEHRMASRQAGGGKLSIFTGSTRRWILASHHFRPVTCCTGPLPSPLRHEAVQRSTAGQSRGPLNRSKPASKVPVPTPKVGPRGGEAGRNGIGICRQTEGQGTVSTSREQHWPSRPPCPLRRPQCTCREGPDRARHYARH